MTDDGKAKTRKAKTRKDKTRKDKKDLQSSTQKTKD